VTSARTDRLQRLHPNYSKLPIRVQRILDRKLDAADRRRRQEKT
jgi:hypothetical protein